MALEPANSKPGRPEIESQIYHPNELQMFDQQLIAEAPHDKL